ncbi:MAG: anti-sigma factor [Piscinibacter sp.]|uniref:anti-sigma factor n=1 Tax=Piscinibacter TaxID=1114981 RepID=UPI000FDD1F6F|nr:MULTISPECIES: anti-sigma factor [Piscinibacter]MCW5664795.1 anti-sigma factor [Piscinibacter sp.]
MDYGRPRLADRLAAEYVAGTLRGPARRRFVALLPAHAGLRAAVRAWETRLMPLTTVLPGETPPARVWQRIQAQLDGARPAAPPWWARLAFWRGLSALAGLAALSLAVLLASPGPAQPPLVVVLNATAPAAGAAVVPASFVASISGDGRAVVTRPITAVALQGDRVLELWAAAGRNPPRSLGLISAQGVTVVRRASLPAGTDHLAVSLEPPGGSPTGAPTGPVLAVGNL